MGNEQAKTNVVVVGAGPGGYAAAFMAADLGLEVTVVDPEENPGGVCLYRGCIPTKALLHACKTKKDALGAGQFGMRFGEPELDLDTLRGWKDEVVGKLTGGLGQLVKQRKIRHIRGRARFADARTLELDTGEGPGRLAFEQAIIATGSEPVALGGLSFAAPQVLNSAKALELERIPDSLLVIGGGYIGLELGTVYAELGSRVSIVEMMPGLMPGADRDLMATYTKAIKGQFEAVYTSTKARIELHEEGVEAHFEGEGAPGESKRYGAVLVTVGRRPYTDGLGLEKTKVERDEKGYVRTDARCRTAEESIYAIGDVTGPPLLAHKASHEGRVAAEVIAGKKSVFEPKAIPAVEYTDPEVAWCGLTETEAKERGRDVRVVKFPWAASGRAMTLAKPAGLTKLIVDPQNDRILGAGIVGTDAGELICEAALAVEMAATATDLALTIHPHPTLGETIMEAAEMVSGTSTHVYRPKRR
jgi:dihydrolipoamide dehydrogenase